MIYRFLHSRSKTFDRSYWHAFTPKSNNHLQMKDLLDIFLKDFQKLEVKKTFCYNIVVIMVWIELKRKEYLE